MVKMMTAAALAAAMFMMPTSNAMAGCGPPRQHGAGVPPELRRPDAARRTDDDSRDAA